MLMKTIAATTALCIAAASVNAQSVITPDGDVIMIEKNQVAAPAIPTTTVAANTTVTTIFGGVTVGTAVVGGVLAAIVIGAVSSDGATGGT